MEKQPMLTGKTGMNIHENSEDLDAIIFTSNEFCFLGVLIT
ncbi:hypothetical protein [Bacillus massilioanorexius]|nr:hypothetical protein [Bacillus massilioanorexius]